MATRYRNAAESKAANRPGGALNRPGVHRIVPMPSVKPRRGTAREVHEQAPSDLSDAEASMK
jgi:hypothetical protein